MCCGAALEAALPFVLVAVPEEIGVGGLFAFCDGGIILDAVAFTVGNVFLGDEGYFCQGNG